MAEILELRQDKKLRQGKPNDPVASTGVAEVRRLRAILGDTDPRAAVDREMPLLAPFEELFGRGLRRGAVVAVDGDTARMSLAMALMAQVSAEGGWCGVVGVPSFGYVAAHELGLRIDQLVLVPDSGPEWAEVTAALLSGLDAVLVQPSGPVPGQLARRLAARARRHSCTLLTLGPVWEGSDVRVTAVGQEWVGLLPGLGRLRGRRVRVVASTRPGIELDMWLPGQSGTVQLIDVRTIPLSMRGQYERTG
jgi:hypothetical protein